MIAALMSLTICAFAQNQEPLCCTKAGTELCWSQLDAKGNETGTTISIIDSVTGSNGNYRISMTTKVMKNNKLQVDPVIVSGEVVNGACPVNLCGGLIMELLSEVPLLPSKLNIGDNLGSGTISLLVAGIKITQEVSSYKCIAHENVKTRAGSFDCYVMEQAFVSKLGIVSIEGVSKIYYAPGVGIVKILSSGKKGNVFLNQELKYIGPKRSSKS